MKNLIKYEFRKTLSVKLILLGTAALAQLAFMIGLWTGRERIYSLGAFILLLLAFVGVAVIGLTSVLILHRDMNTKQSYMLFMTPNSCYKILGAKVIENGISLLLATVFFFALGALDVSMLMAHEGRLADLWSLVTQFLEGIDSRITLDTETLMSFAFGLLASWFSTVTCAYLADVVSTALLKGKRWNGLGSFALFILLSALMNWALLRLTDGIASVRTVFLVQAGISMVFSAIMYVLTAQIMERKLSV